MKINHNFPVAECFEREKKRNIRWERFGWKKKKTLSIYVWKLFLIKSHKQPSLCCVMFFFFWFAICREARSIFREFVLCVSDPKIMSWWYNLKSFTVNSFRKVQFFDNRIFLLAPSCWCFFFRFNSITELEESSLF